MRRRRCHEHGQTVLEFALVATALLMMTTGLVDMGRGFYQYNNLSAAARYGARWGSVMGGTCALPYARSTSDWCDQLGNSAGGFWSQLGNKPIQGLSVACPSYSATPSDYYTVSGYTGNSATTIVGAIANKFDSSSSSSNFITGAVTPGLDLSQLRVCIQLDITSTAPQTGDAVKVYAYYPFHGVSALLFGGTINLNASSQYQVE